MSDNKRVGFWKSTSEPDLPMPVAKDVPDVGQGPFLAALRRVEESIERSGEIVRYRGWSRCRICDKGNGSAEFVHRGFVWPTGFRHYVVDHNVTVPDEFRQMIFTADLLDFPAPKVFWVSWVQTEDLGPFELHSPWWYTGRSAKGTTVCAAIRAEDSDGARVRIFESYDSSPFKLDWRFVEERDTNWSPFSERFPCAKWMIWPS